MPKIVENRLADRGVRTLPDGEHLDGRGLSLKVTKPARSWILRFWLHGRRRRMGLGSYPDVSLTMARERALAARRLVADGIDPIAARRAERRKRELPNFAAVVDEFMEGISARGQGCRSLAWPAQGQRLAAARPPAHRPDRPRRALPPAARYPCPGAGHVGQDRPGTIAVIGFALGRGYIKANPLEAAPAALPRDFGSRARKGHPMVRITDLPGFYAARVEASHGRGALCALALRFVTLTAARSGEVRLANWTEIDGTYWRIPGRADRATMVEKRRRLMAQWADYLSGAGKGQVVQLAEHRA